MSKVTLLDVTDLSSNSAVTTVNANSATIEVAFDNTISRDGTAPNQMNANLDMNGFAISNCSALTATSLTNAANDAAAAVAGVALNSLYRNGSIVMIRVS